MPVIYVEGNIAVGKSTFLQNIESELTPEDLTSVLREPVRDWTMTPVGDVLAAATADPTLSAPFQVTHL